jgi:hypothetical protein
VNQINHVTAQLTFHFGMENIVSFVHQELNLIQKRNNVIIAQMDSLEIHQVTHAFQDFEKQIDFL